MADQFTEKITVKDEWENNGERFRLVDKGAGPMELQTINPHTNDVDWKPERDHYVHGVLCARIIELETIRLEDHARAEEIIKAREKTIARLQDEIHANKRI